MREYTVRVKGKRKYKDKRMRWNGRDEEMRE